MNADGRTGSGSGRGGGSSSDTAAKKSGFVVALAVALGHCRGSRGGRGGVGGWPIDYPAASVAGDHALERSLDDSSKKPGFKSSSSGVTNQIAAAVHMQRFSTPRGGVRHGRALTVRAEVAARQW